MWERAQRWYGREMVRGQRPPRSSSTTGQLVVGDRGRLVLPAGIRAELGLTTGSRLLINTEPDGSLRLRPYRAVADAGRGLLAHLGQGSMVDELVDERRGAAAAEAEGGEAPDVAGE